MASAIVSISFFFFFCVLLPTVFSYNPPFRKLSLPKPSYGPNSFAFDSAGEGPYTTVFGGGILKYIEKNNSFVTFAHIPKDRTGAGLGFYFKTGQLYVTEFHALLVVGPEGGVAKPVATGAAGVPFTFLGSLEVDQKTGIVYFVEHSLKYHSSQVAEMIKNGDETGRLMKYDPITKTVTVLLNNLSGASGVAISKDGSYLLVTEYLKGSILKYWLTGPKSKTTEDFPKPYSGNPQNIKRNEAGEFWVAVSHSEKETGQRITENGNLLQRLNLIPDDFDSTYTSVVQEHEGNLYLGSVENHFIGIYELK